MEKAQQFQQEGGKAGFLLGEALPFPFPEKMFSPGSYLDVGWTLSHDGYLFLYRGKAGK